MAGAGVAFGVTFVIVVLVLGVGFFSWYRWQRSRGRTWRGRTIVFDTASVTEAATEDGEALLEKSKHSAPGRRTHWHDHLHLHLHHHEDDEEEDVTSPTLPLQYPPPDFPNVDALSPPQSRAGSPPSFPPRAASPLSFPTRPESPRPSGSLQSRAASPHRGLPSRSESPRPSGLPSRSESPRPSGLSRAVESPRPSGGLPPAVESLRAAGSTSRVPSPRPTGPRSPGVPPLAIPQPQQQQDRGRDQMTKSIFVDMYNAPDSAISPAVMKSAVEPPPGFSFASSSSSSSQPRAPPEVPSITPPSTTAPSAPPPNSTAPPTPGANLAKSTTRVYRRRRKGSTASALRPIPDTPQSVYIDPDDPSWRDTIMGEFELYIPGEGEEGLEEEEGEWEYRIVEESGEDEGYWDAIPQSAVSTSPPSPSRLSRVSVSDYMRTFDAEDKFVPPVPPLPPNVKQTGKA